MTNSIDNSNFSDSRLVQLISQGDYLAFKEIYERYINKLYAYANNLNLDEADIDDVLQEVFASLWLRRESVSIDNLSAWLFMSVRKQMLFRIRKKKYRDQYLDNIIDFISPFYDPITEVIQEKQLREFLDNEIAKLPARMQEIFRMSREEFLTHKEIALQLGISEKTVRKQISNVLKIFRSKLSYKGVELIILIGYLIDKK
ncbi:RNA polymerase sigma factor [Sphingobacterium hungaricum]|uniref:RNA polymerase subunit sigma-70 n=1 Tax=Sphingobacterium hungaricum TaxID=2082723 RepID=A0A928UXN0_9SPHI|nr:sigma-70 family RNA polymerase sigma factor [Sphingobacterium hungaricum]MBE8712474.1 RNA polymerase subunit sigma-70 [Sphingobacterium hungaricum]